VPQVFEADLADLCLSEGPLVPTAQRRVVEDRPGVRVPEDQVVVGLVGQALEMALEARAAEGGEAGESMTARPRRLV
jgi:hypothetical protein